MPLFLKLILSVLLFYFHSKMIYLHFIYKMVYKRL